jgi:hypothetical protein
VNGTASILVKERAYDVWLGAEAFCGPGVGGTRYLSECSEIGLGVEGVEGVACRWGARCGCLQVHVSWNCFGGKAKC